METEHKEDNKIPTDHEALSGNGERRSSKGAVEVGSLAHDGSASHDKASPIVTGRPKCNSVHVAKHLDDVIPNEGMKECNGSRSLDEVVNEPENNDKTPVSASTGQGDQKVLLGNKNRSMDKGTII